MNLPMYATDQALVYALIANLPTETTVAFGECLECVMSCQEHGHSGSLRQQMLQLVRPLAMQNSWVSDP